MNYKNITTWELYRRLSTSNKLGAQFKTKIEKIIAEKIRTGEAEYNNLQINEIPEIEARKIIFEAIHVLNIILEEQL